MVSALGLTVPLSLAEERLMLLAAFVVSVADTVQVGQLNWIRSKSGAQLPTIGLKNSSVLQPVFKTTVVCIDPTV